jgi:chromosome segregation ATPase
MSDTTISDSTPHNVADLGMLCRRLERELNAANADVERLTKANLQLREGCEELQQRIKRLESWIESLEVLEQHSGILPEREWFGSEIGYLRKGEAVYKGEAKP